MVVGIAVFELHLPAARSLKEKRKVVKSLVERIHHHHRVSVAEVGYHDLHQRAEIAIAAVAVHEGEIRERLAALRRFVDADGEAFVTQWNDQLLEGEEG